MTIRSMPVRSAILVLLLGRAAAAQDIPEFHKLRTPVSPAFQILGIAPAHVERPTTPATFAASVLQKVQDFSGVLPKSMGVEVAPFWLQPHPSMTFTEYQRQGWKSVYRNFTVSLATTDSVGDGGGPPDSNADWRRLGFGMRTTLLPGSRGVTPTCVREISAAATAHTTAIGALVARAIEAGRLSRSNSVAIEAFQNADSTRAEARASLSRWQQDLLSPEGVGRCTADLSARRGAAMDVAVAAAATFPEGRATSGEISSVGVWITPAILGDRFSNIAVLRLAWHDLDSTTSRNTFDAGLRSVYAWDRYATSLELVNRLERRSGETSDFIRIALNFDVKIAGDTWLNVALGKDFDARQPQSLLALLGFQWQLGDRSVHPDK
jgi:hypothetical protein